MKQKLVLFATRFIPVYPLRFIYEAWAKINAFLRYGDFRFARIITFEVSAHCNRSCTYCPNNHEPNAKKLISEETLQVILNRFKEMKWYGTVDFIFFNEPLLHPNLPDIVRRLKEAAPNCIPRVSTNGDALTEKNFLALRDAGMMRFYVMRHNPRTDEWMDRMTYLQEKYPGYIQLMDIDKLAEDSGLHDFGGLFKVEKFREIKKCVIHETTLQVDIDGRVLLCCTDWSRSTVMGDLHKEGFLDIWRKPEFKRIRKELRNGITSKRLCAECMHKVPLQHKPNALSDVRVELSPEKLA